ncbi:MAG: hypothetical protein ACHQEM_11350 [Chitinophagales bacterium]
MKTSIIPPFGQSLRIFCMMSICLHAQAQRDPSSEEYAFTNYKFEITTRSFILPEVQPKWRYSQAISFSYVDLPNNWTLNQINAPILTYSSKFSLPAGFNLQASLSTLVISNQLEFGPFWNYSSNHFHFGVGWQAAYSLGFLNQFGYKSTVSGWTQEPCLIAGHSFRKSALTLKVNLYLNNKVQFHEGGHELPMYQTFFNGYAISGSFEQRIYKNKVLQLTVKLNSVNYYFLAWPVFPGSQSRYLIPEFKVGLNF